MSVCTVNSYNKIQLFITIELLKTTLDENKKLGAQLIHNNNKNVTPSMLLQQYIHIFTCYQTQIYFCSHLSILLFKMVQKV